MNRIKRIANVFFSFAALLLIACPTTDEPGQVLTLKITEKNDSLLHFDSLIVTVHSKDGAFSQVVFHDSLRDAKQVRRMPLDPRVGKDYTVTIVGYRNGKVGVNKEIIFIGEGAQSKDLPIKLDVPETVVVSPNLPEITTPLNTSIAEGDSLRFRVSVRNPWTGVTTLTLKEALSGAVFDTAGLTAGEASFTWRPTFDQGRAEAYTVTFVYSAADKKVEKSTRIQVLNVNRQPKITVLPDQKVKAKEVLSYKVEASDPDHDSLTFTAADLPAGATFAKGLFTWTPAENQAGSISVRFKVTDGIAFDSMTVHIAVSGATPLPGKPIVQGQAFARDKMPTWTWKSGGDGTGIFRYRLDDENFFNATSTRDSSYTPAKELDEGSHTLFVQESNADRAWSLSGRFSIRIDLTPPGAPKVSVNPSSPSNNQKPVWTWLSGGGGIGGFRFALNDGDLASRPEAKVFNFTPEQNLAEGKHILYVQERDSAGNWSATAEAAIQLDLTPPPTPTVTITASLTNNPRPTWSWSSNGGGGTGAFRFRLDNSDLKGTQEVKITSYQPDKDQAEGVHILYVQERDSVGNWSISGQGTIRIDLTPPASPVFDSLPKSPLNSLQPTWTWKSGGGGNGLYRVSLDNGKLEEGGTLMKANSYLAPMVLTAALHTLYIQEADSAGNFSAPTSKALALAIREIVGSAGFSTGAATHPSLAIDASGTPYVAFQETNTGSKGTVMRFNGTSWEAVGSPGFALGGRYPSLALNKKGEPYIAFQSDNQKVSVMRFNGTSWVFVGNPEFSGAWGYSISLALNSTGAPYVCYIDGDHGDKAMVQRFNGTTWEAVGASVSVGRVSDAVLALNSKDVPYIAYSDSASGYKAKVMSFNGTLWEIVGSASISSGIGTALSLALSSTDVPYVAFKDEANGKKATVMSFNGTGWKAVGAPGFSPGVIGVSSLALTAAGLPCIAFEDAANSSKATVMRFNGTAWEAVGGTGITTAAAYEVSMALTSTGVPYVAYFDAANANKVTVMKTSFDP
jgi:hypothetical protein